MVLSVLMAFSAEASFFPYFNLTCCNNSSTCSLKRFDLKDSAVYTPSWRLDAGRFVGFDTVVAFTAGAGMLSASSAPSSSDWSSPSLPSSRSSRSSKSSAPFIDTSLSSAPSSAAPALVSDAASLFSSKPAKLPSLAASESLCSSFRRLVMCGAIGAIVLDVAG
jgi:hypothetical protein